MLRQSRASRSVPGGPYREQSERFSPTFSLVSYADFTSFYQTVVALVYDH